MIRWVMIAQWDSSLSVLPVARVMIAQWDSSLPVFPVARVMITQWDTSLPVLPVARVQFPATAEYFKGFLPGWSHSANPSWASLGENGSIPPQWHHTTCGQRGGRPKFNHGQTMADRKNCMTYQTGNASRDELLHHRMTHPPILSSYKSISGPHWENIPFVS